MLIQKHKQTCTICPDAWCYLCPHRKRLIGYRHKLYLSPNKQQLFKLTLADYKCRNYSELFTLTADTPYETYVECTSYQALCETRLVELFPYIERMELNEPVSE